MYGQKFEDGLKLYKNSNLKKSALIFSQIYKSKAKDELRGKAFFYLIKTKKSRAKRIQGYSKFMREFSSHPLYPQVIFNMAIIYMNMKKYSYSIALFKGIVKTNKLWPQSRLRLAQLYLKNKNYKMSIGSFKTLLAYKVTTAELKSKAVFGMGLAYEKDNQLKKAESAYLKILNSYLKGGEVSGALYHLGNLYYNKKDWQMANDWFEKIMRNYPNSFDAYLARGKLLILKTHLKSREKVLIYEVQIAAYKYKKNAELYLKKIVKKYPRAFIFKQENKMFSLRIGFFKNRAGAKRQLINLKKNGIPGFIRNRKILVTEINFVR